MHKPLRARRRLSLNDVRERHECARYFRRYCRAPVTVDLLCLLAHRNRRLIYMLGAPRPL